MPRFQTLLLAAVLLFVSQFATALGQTTTVPIDQQGLSVATLQNLIGMGGSTSATAILGVILYKLWGLNEKQATQFTATLKELADNWKEERKEFLEIVTENTRSLDKILGSLGRRSGDAPTPPPLKGNRDDR